MRPGEDPERTSVMSKKKMTAAIPPVRNMNKEKGCNESVRDSFLESVWNRNTDLCMDVKTLLREDRRTILGKHYPGMLMRDGEFHYQFVETLPVRVKRNPHVYEGRYITVTRRDDGSLRPNFKPVTMGCRFSTVSYAWGVCRELIEALSGLVGKEARED